eukprot:TRINITY_DN3687_c0_g1_i4.p1 TRINITY_DN3687_c0_g1~~TRINITY_DN3687_c0_g1_i4.p1  ORF type:complete len:1928 (+),score=648.14 TRINITY_DN3687_c0_g1_i4:175-5958(+)
MNYEGEIKKEETDDLDLNDEQISIAEESSQFSQLEFQNTFQSSAFSVPSQEMKEFVRNVIKEESEKIVFVNLLRGGYSQRIQVPNSYEELEARAQQDFQLDEPIQFFDMGSKLLKEEEFHVLQNGEIEVLLVLKTSEEGKMTEKTNLVVNITPKKEILLKGGTAEYDVASALAEIIDNSIQAVKGNAKGDKRIKISMNNESISIWDNGTGMNSDGLQKWATMGVTQSDEAHNGLSQVSGGSSHRGFISRFGVGAKKAGFFLGNDIVVTSKSTNSEWIAELNLSRDVLKKYGNDWKADLGLRPPTPEEKERSHSWTEITISSLNISENKEKLGKRLAHIYYYYIHGEDSYSIEFDGNPLSNEQNDMESLYESKGINPIHFEFKVNWETSVESKKISIASNVKVQLMYYPYTQQDGETIPNPSEEDKELVTLARKPGVEVFWNDRLITEAYLPFDEFGIKRTSKIEERVLSRVHGKIFLNSDFPVTHNKRTISKGPAFDALKQCGDRRNNEDNKRFKDWITDCHTKYDEELFYIGEEYNAHNNTTTCKGFRIGDKEFKIGDKVCIVKNKQGLQIAILKGIKYAGSPSDRESKGRGELTTYSITKSAGIDFEEQLNKIDRVANQKDLKEYESKMKKKLPALVRFIENEHRLPDSIIVQKSIKNIAVEVLDSDEKPIDGKGIDCEITLVVVRLETKERFTNTTTRFWKKGIVCFTNTKCFSHVGTYKISSVFTFGGKESGQVQGEERTIEVKPGKPEKYFVRLADRSETKFAVDSDPPELILYAEDSNGFRVPLDSNHQFDMRCSIDGKNSKIKAFSASVNEKKELVINRYKFSNNTVNSSGSKAVISISSDDDSITADECEFTVVPGSPSKLEFKDSPLGEKDKPFRIQNETSLPSFGVQLKDKFGNVIAEPLSKVQLQLTTEGLKKKDNIKRDISNDGTTVFENIEVVSNTNRGRIIVNVVASGRKIEGLQLEKQLEIWNRKTVLKFEMFDEKGSLILPNDVNKYQIPVGNIITEYKMYLLIEEYDEYETIDDSIEINATVTLPWTDESFLIKSKERRFQLPSITSGQNITSRASQKIEYVPEIGRNQIMKVDFIYEATVPSQISIKLSQNSKIRCGKPTKWTLIFKDEFNNLVSPSKVKESDESLLDLNRWVVGIQPSTAQNDLKIENYRWNLDSKSETLELEVKFAGIGTGKLEIVENEDKMTDSNPGFKTSFDVNVIAGAASCILVNKVDEFKVECEEGGIMEDLVINICDDYKHVQSLNGISIVMIVELGYEELPFQTPKIVVQDGEFRLSGLVCNGKPGDYLILVDSSNQKLKTCYIELTVKENDRIPKSIRMLEEQQNVNVKVGNPFPPLQFQVLNGKGTVVNTNLASNNLILNWMGKSHSQSLLDNETHTFCFSDIDVGTKAGSYPLTVSYDFKLDTSFDINVLPDTLSKLIVLNWDNNTVVSSVSHPIASGLEILPADQFDNICSVEGNLKLKVCVEPQATISVNGGEPSESVLVEMIEGRAKLERLNFVGKTPSGQYTLKFVVEENQNLGLDLPFVYTDDEEARATIDKNKEQINQTKNKLNELKGKCEILSQDKRKSEQKEKNDEMKLKSEANNLASFFRRSFPNFSMEQYLSSEERMLDTIQRTQLRIDNAREPRKARMQPNATLEKLRKISNGRGATGIVGVIPDLIFVDDEKISQVMAKLAHSRLNGVVFQDTKTLEQYYDEYKKADPINYISLSNCNEREREPTTYPNSPLEGFVDFSINCIRMRPQHDGLKNTVGFVLFGDTMLFQKLSQGQKYRDWCKTHRKKCPTLLIIDECQLIESQGWIRGGSTPNQTVWSFGAYPESERAQLEQSKETQTLILNNFRELKKNKEIASLERQKIETELNTLREEIKSWEEKQRGFEEENQNLSLKRKSNESEDNSDTPASKKQRPARIRR